MKFRGKSLIMKKCKQMDKENENGIQKQTDERNTMIGIRISQKKVL